MPVRDVLLALMVVAIWGFNFVVIKMSVTALPPILAAGFRFALAAFPALLFVRPPKTSWLYTAGFGLAFGLALYSFLNLSLSAGMPAGLASVVLQVQAFFTMAIAFAVLGERPRRLQLVGAGIAFCGIGVIGYARLDGAAPWPFLLTLCAALAWGCANVISKKAGRVNPVAITVWGSAIACIPLIGLSVLMDGTEPLVRALTRFDPGLVLIIGFLAYPATLFGLAVWNWLLSRHPASVVAPFTLLVPITGLLSGWIVLGETMSPLEIAGGALVVTGLGVTVLKKRGAATINPVLPEV